MFRVVLLVIAFCLGAPNGSLAQIKIKMNYESGIYTIPCTVNGLDLKFIFDTGASNVTISLTEALFMVKNGYLNVEDIYGSSYAQLANGEIVENTEIVLKEIIIGGLPLYDVKASIVHESAAPLLLGQTAISKLGKIQLDGDELIIMTKAGYRTPTNNYTLLSRYGVDSIKCRENLYSYYGLARKKQFLKAFSSWKYVYENCPASSKNNFIYGPYIVEAKLKEVAKAGKESAEQKYKELLLEVYDNRNKYYPGQEGYVYQRKALDMVQHFPDSSMAAYKLFKKALEMEGPEQSAVFYNYYFVTAARLFNADVLTRKDIFTTYNVVKEGIEINKNVLNTTIAKITEQRDSNAKTKAELAEAKRDLARYAKVESNIDAIIKPLKKDYPK